MKKIHTCLYEKYAEKPKTSSKCHMMLILWRSLESCT